MHQRQQKQKDIPTNNTILLQMELLLPGMSYFRYYEPEKLAQLSESTVRAIFHSKRQYTNKIKILN